MFRWTIPRVPGFTSAAKQMRLLVPDGRISPMVLYGTDRYTNMLFKRWAFFAFAYLQTLFVFHFTEILVDMTKKKIQRKYLGAAVKCGFLYFECFFLLPLLICHFQLRVGWPNCCAYAISLWPLWSEIFFSLPSLIISLFFSCANYCAMFRAFLKWGMRSKEVRREFRRIGDLSPFVLFGACRLWVGGTDRGLRAAAP